MPISGLQASCFALLALSAGVAAKRRDAVRLGAMHVEDLPVGSESRSHWDNVTKSVVYEQIGRCYDPEADWSSRKSPAPWEEEFGRAVLHARSNATAPHGQALIRPVEALRKMVGVFSSVLPHHRAVALTSDRDREVPSGRNHPDSHCFLFDYANYREGDPDPHGCWFFRKSFKPLKELRQCIINKLDSSRGWRSYLRAMRKVLLRRLELGVLPNTENPLIMGTDEQVLSEMNVKVAFDSIRRADEMIKTVGFKDWDSWESGIIHEVERKISKTIVTTSKKSVLEDATIAAIRAECFQVNADGAKELPRQALTLKRAMPCYQLMWDQVEVAGAPEQPLSNAITMWSPTLVQQGMVEHDYNSPPVCARAATALIGEQQKRAPGGYSMTACTMMRPSWRTCMKPMVFNCICFQYCWREAMRRVCELNPSCCATANAAASSMALARE